MKPTQNTEFRAAIAGATRPLAGGVLLARSSNSWRIGALGMLVVALFSPASSQAQMVTNNPVEASAAFGNPLMGFRNDLNGYSQYPYRTVVRQYIRWNEIENDESDTVQKIRDFCNAKWVNLPTNNIKVIPRVYLDWSSETNNEYWPADLQNGDWTSQKFKDRVVRLIGRLGEAWDNDPRVAWVQTGIIGYWGEQENPVGVDEDGWAQRMGDAYTNAFKNKRLIVRNMNHWPGYEMGLYWDSFSHPAQQGQWSTHRSIINEGRYLTQVVEGEVAYGWGTNVAIPRFGVDPDATLTDPQYTDNIIETIRELHASALGWVASYNPNDPAIKTNAARMQREFGYRFHITEFACSARAEPGANLNVRFRVKNKGSAPFYEDWPVALVLIQEASRQIAWKVTLPNVDIRTWHPGANYDTNSRAYLTPPQEHLVAASVQLPANLAPGQYLVGVSILEPLSRTPGIFFAVPNFFKQSQTQPLCRIGVGVNVGTHLLNGVTFDDLELDDKRFYIMKAQGLTNTLLALPSTNGFISLKPGGGVYAKDTGVEVTANGNLGYAFSSWGGALAGMTNNPVIIPLGTNYSIHANYIPVPIYTLATGATNGTLALSPPGGVYNEGAVVTVTANPARGYQFGSWSGALAGATNPATITVNGNLNLAASFVPLPGDLLPWLETFSLPNGAKSNGPPTTWTAIRASGVFQVSGNRFMINQGSAEGVLETSEISIAGGRVRASLQVQPGGGLDSGDYVQFYKLVDGGPKVLLGEQIGNFTGTNTMVGTNISGNRLKLRIEAKVSAGDEYYYFDNLRVEDEAVPPTYTLATGAPNGSVILSPAGGIYSSGTVVTVTAIPNYGYTFSNWSGSLGGSLNPAMVTMNSDKSVLASFTLIPTYVLATSASSGIITLNPPGGVYPSGTVVTVAAVPNNGYGFSHWSGGLSGSVNPMTVMLNGNMNVTANFAVSFGEPLPWTVNFNGLASGVTSQGWPASWTASRGGVFRVLNDRLEINGSGGEGVFTTGVINIAGRTVNLSLGVQGAGGLDSGDYVRLYIKTNGSPERLVRQVIGALAATNWIQNGITGTNLQVVIRTSVSANDEFYYFDNLSVTNATPIPPRVSITWAQSPPQPFGQVQLQWAGGGTLQSAPGPMGPWSDLTGATSPHASPATNTTQLFRIKQ